MNANVGLSEMLHLDARDMGHLDARDMMHLDAKVRHYP